MELRFLGAATTVTGSQFLLVTKRAKVLIADESELLDWIGNFARGKKPGDRGFPKRVFLVHGDPPAEAAIEPKVKALGFDTHVPVWRETVQLA